MSENGCLGAVFVKIFRPKFGRKKKQRRKKKRQKEKRPPYNKTGNRVGRVIFARH
jgi:hypothetical protein